jgi:hypothetical protein
MSYDGAYEDDYPPFDYVEDDGADDWAWCPDCGELREICFSWNQCPTGIEAKAYQERAEKLLEELEETGTNQA